MRRLVVTALGIGSWFAACTVFDGRSVPLAVEESFDARGSEHAPPPEDGPGACSRQDYGDGYLTLAEAARACAWVAECPQLSTSIAYSHGVPADDSNFSLCMHWLAGPVPSNHPGTELQRASLRCIAGAKSCDEASACVPYQVIDGSQSCTDGGIAGGDAGGPHSRCIDGNTVLRCDFYEIWHCQNPAFGSPAPGCVKGADGESLCGASGCTPMTCQGSAMVGCADGVNTNINCAAAALNCKNDPVNGFVCYSGLPAPPNGSCPIGQLQCAGSKAQVCVSFDYAEYDCAAIGKTCATVGGTALCTAKDDACTPNDLSVNACDPSGVLTACVGGERRCVECAGAGLKCSGPANGKTARCSH